MYPLQCSFSSRKMCGLMLCSSEYINVIRETQTETNSYLNVKKGWKCINRTLKNSIYKNNIILYKIIFLYVWGIHKNTLNIQIIIADLSKMISQKTLSHKNNILLFLYSFESKNRQQTYYCDQFILTSQTFQVSWAPPLGPYR